jgi:outer membrane protein insertion porin family
VVREVAQKTYRLITISPALLRSALALCAVVGAAAPSAAQTSFSTALNLESFTLTSQSSAKPKAVLLSKASKALASQKQAQAPAVLPSPQPSSDVSPSPSPSSSPLPSPASPSSTEPPASTPSSSPAREAAPPAPAPDSAVPGSSTPTAPVPDSPIPGSAPGTEVVPPPPTEPGTEPGTKTVPQPPTTSPQPTTEETAPERQVLVSEVKVEGAEGDLANKIYEATTTRPGQSTTRSQLQVDINAIFATGYFSAVRAEPTDTPLGVRVTFIVQPNPILKSVQPAGNKVLTQAQVDEIFQPQYGKILNLRDLQEGIKAINKFYQDKGYVLGQVAGSPQIDPDGTVTLQVAEGVIENIDVRYKNKAGEVAKGRTRKYIVLRELRTKPGDVLNKDMLQKDLRRIFELGLFEDVQVALEPGEDPRKVVVNLNVQERRTGSLSLGGGYSSDSGIFGTATYSQNNLGGNNQKLNTQIQVGPRILLFDASFTDPWIGGDPFHTSYTVGIFNRLTIPLVFDGGNTDVNLGDPKGTLPANPLPGQVYADTGITPRVNRLGASLVFSRPFTRDPDKIATAWTASAGIQYQRVSILDDSFNVSRYDIFGNNLSFSGKGQDDLLTVQLGLARDLRNDPQTPTKGSVVRFGIEQSLPVGLGSITLTRLRASYSQFVPISLVHFTKGPQALAFNVQAGTTVGDLPPYEAFTLGGGSSVRGYGEGDVGSGRSFLQASAEYRFPLLKFLGGIGGVLFVDYGTLLGTQDDVPGRPGIVRGKPGDGLGYGVGLRIKTPIGPVRLDYGWNIDGGSKFQFGFQEKF